jgi:hypothetical protein
MTYITNPYNLGVVGTGVAALIKIIYITPEVLNFGSVTVGSSIDKKITISCPGISDPITGRVGELSPPFYIIRGGGAFKLNPYTEKDVWIRFTPTSIANYNVVLYITHNAGNRISPAAVDISGAGAAAVSFIKTHKTAAGEVEVKILGDVNLQSCDVKKIGKLSVGFDDDSELIFFPSNLGITFKDSSKILYDYLRLNAQPVEVKLNGASYYKGIVDIMTTKHNVKLKETSLTVFDESNILKDIKIKDNGGNAINPLSYADASYCNVQSMLRDIFKKINPDVNININQDWVFKRWASAGGNLHGFSEIYVPTSTFFFGTKPFTTLAELLKSFAQNFGCAAGMLDKNNAYFIKRWKSTAGVISLADKIKKITKLNFLKKLDGICVVQNAPTMTPKEYNEGTVEREQSGEFKHPDKTLQIDLWAGCSDTATNIMIWDGTLLRPIGTVKDEAIDSLFREVRQTTAKYHYNYRKVYRQKFEIELRGVDFSILNLYTAESLTLRPYKIEKDIETNTTQMIAVDIT